MEARIEFHIDDLKGFEATVRWLEENYGAEELKSYMTDIQHLLQGGIRVSVNGAEEDSSKYMPVKKAYAYRKRDAALLCALIHDNPDNLRQVLSRLPSWYSEAITLMVLNGYASETDLRSVGAESMLSRKDHYSWERFSPGKYSSLFGACSCMKDEPIPQASYWETEGYLFIPNYLQLMYARVLLPGFCQISACLNDEPGFIAVKSEESYLRTFPVIQGLQRQLSVPVTAKLKLSCASAKKLQASIPELVPESVRRVFKVCTGQYFLPGLLWALQKKNLTAVEAAKRSYDRMLKAYPDQLYPAFLPHIKGFRANQFRYVPDVPWMKTLCQFLGRYPDKWISLPALTDYLHITGSAGYTLRASLLRDLRLENQLTGEIIRPNTQGSEIDHEILRAMAVVLFGTGMADVSVDTSEDFPDSPLGRVMQVRLTALGRYVLGIDKKYEAPSSQSETAFSLDADRLIIHSLGDDNPYESLLLDTAEPIGHGKFRTTPESFLRNCKNANDVTEKLKFFEDYIDGNPPEVWKEFFAEIRRRCKPLDTVSENYRLLQLKPQDKELVDLLTTDPSIRRLVILAEGYRFLVKAGDFPTLVSLLKQHSYLL